MMASASVRRIPARRLPTRSSPGSCIGRSSRTSPAPQGFTYVTRGNRSYSYGQGGVRVARFQYWGPMAPEEVTDFYKRTMGLRAFDWQFISESSPGPRAVALDFRKGRQTCKVTINAESGATYITVDVAGLAEAQVHGRNQAEGPRMAETAGKPPPEGVEKVAPSSNSWERLLNDWQKRPKAWITYLVVAAVIALGALIAFQYFGSRTTDQENERADLLNKALGEADAAEQAARLDDLRDKVAGTRGEAYVLWLSASKRKEAGDLTEVPEEKLAHYEKALEAVETLRSRFPGNPLVTLPWRPVQPAAPPAPSLAAGLEEYCKQQISWLKAHPVLVAEEADPGASGKIVVADPDGKEHTLDLKFFSKDAPYAVDVFFDLAQKQVYDGTLIHGLERDDPNTEDNHAVHLGSAMSKLAPDKPETWGG